MAPRMVGSKVAPVVVTYGCRVKITFGLMTDDEAVRISRCFPIRYSAFVMLTVSASGLTVTVVNSAAEVVVPFDAVMLRLITEGRTWPTGSVGALKLTIAEDVVFCVTTRLSSAGTPDWLTLNVSGSPPGLTPLTAKLPFAPEASEIGATWLTVGAAGALTVTVVDETELPWLFVAVSTKCNVVETPGAVNVALAVVAPVRITCDVSAALWVQLNVGAGFPVALPAKVTIAPAAAV